MTAWWSFLAVFLCLAAGVTGVSAYDLLDNRADYTTNLYTREVVAADFDNDGDVDLATCVSNRENNGIQDSVEILRNDGHGIFIPGERYKVGDAPISMVADDFDRNDYVDLAVANWGEFFASVLYNRYGQSFEASGYCLLDYVPPMIKSADLNGDQWPDLLVGKFTFDPMGEVIPVEISFFFNQRNGQFAGRVDYEVPGWVESAAIADIDSDGDQDLVMVCNQVGYDELVVRFNRGNGSFYIGYSIGYQYGYQYDFGSLITSDFDSDGDDDLAVGIDGSLSVLINPGTGIYALDNRIDCQGYAPQYMTVCDLDLDGDTDIVGSGGGGYISTFLNDGTGQFELTQSYGSGSSFIRGLGNTDFDGDGDIDIAVANSEPGAVSVFFNQTYTGKGGVSQSFYSAEDAFDNIPSLGFAYIGELDGPNDITDIDPFSVKVNGLVQPSSYAIVQDYGSIEGDVLKMTFDFDSVVKMLPLGCRTQIQWNWPDWPETYLPDEYLISITGNYTDGSRFAAGAPILLYGLVPGDVNLDGKVSIGDPIYLLNYLFRGGPPPQAETSGDANSDGSMDIFDVLYLIDYMFRGGPSPLCWD